MDGVAVYRWNILSIGGVAIGGITSDEMYGGNYRGAFHL